MWIHILLFFSFCALFFCAKGLFSTSGKYLAGKLPVFMNITDRQISTFLVTIFVGNLVGMTVTAVSWINEEKDLRVLARQEEAYTEELYVSDGKNREKITVEVGTEPYSDEEKLQLLEEAASTLKNEILGENQSLDHVEHPLNLMGQIKGTTILVSWDTDQPLILDWEGQIGEAVPEDGTRVRLRAELVLDDYRKWIDLDVDVFPQKLSESEQFRKEIEEQLAMQNEKQGTSLYLPKELNGNLLTWSKASQYDGVLLVGLAAVIGILLVLSEKSRREQAGKKRQMEMQMDYPGILNKMVLLMQAGISSRRAFQKIALDYNLEREQKGQVRAAYEEILHVYREMEQGISEEAAYRNLGNRCDLLCYRTFSTLLVQNLKKGSSYFISALQQECQMAFEMRKSQALIRGEEAGTKLLLPMGCMLLIVLVIILVPSMVALG